MTVDTLTPGAPPAAARGTFLGYDAAGHAYLLRWDKTLGCWGALGWTEPPPHGCEPWPELRLLRGEHTGLITRHRHIEAPR